MFIYFLFIINLFVVNYFNSNVRRFDLPQEVEPPLIAYFNIHSISLQGSLEDEPLRNCIIVPTITHELKAIAAPMTESVIIFLPIFTCSSDSLAVIIIMAPPAKNRAARTIHSSITKVMAFFTSIRKSQMVQSGPLQTMNLLWAKEKLGNNKNAIKIIKPGINNL